MLGYMKNMVPLFFKIYFLKDSKLLSDLLQVTQFIRGEHRELCLLSWHFALDFTQRGEAGERWRKGERKQRENREREKTRGIKQRPYPFAGICHLKGRRQMHKAISSFPDPWMEHRDPVKVHESPASLWGQHTPGQAFEPPTVWTPEHLPLTLPLADSRPRYPLWAMDPSLSKDHLRKPD